MPSMAMLSPEHDCVDCSKRAIRPGAGSRPSDAAATTDCTNLRTNLPRPAGIDLSLSRYLLPSEAFLHDCMQGTTLTQRLPLKSLFLAGERHT